MKDKLNRSNTFKKSLTFGSILTLTASMTACSSTSVIQKSIANAKEPPKVNT